MLIIFLCVAASLWKSRNSVKSNKPETRFDANAKVEIVPNESDRVPALLPGDTCDKAGASLGNPMEQDKFSRTWKTQAFIITAATDSDCHLTDIAISVLPGHKALTLDGITLGASTLAEAEKILEKPLIEPSESVETAEGHWSATLQLDPVPGMPFKTVYSAYSDEADAMNHAPTISDFRTLPITEYSLEMVTSHSQSVRSDLVM